MTRPLSNDLRERVVAAVAAGESCRAVASRFGVAVSSVVKWSQRYRATGSVAPGKMGGHRKPVLEPHRAFIMERIRPDAASDPARAEGRTGGARGPGLAQCGVAVPAARGAALQKKRCSPLSRPAPTSPAGGGAGGHGRPASIPRRLVFIDETWIKTNMAPLRGWGPKGERLRGFAPHGHWRTLTFLGALRCDRLTAPCVFDGPINGECFRAYVEQQLVPVLKPGDIVIMDNLGSHKSAALRQHHQGRRRTGSGTCRPTHPTSIRSSRPSPRSSTGCAPPRSAPSRTPGDTSAASSQPSNPANAATTSQTPDTLPSKCETL